MGRGRQKAKATKQAREIKYYTPDTDLTALERELAKTRGERESSSRPVRPDTEERSSGFDPYEDKYGR
ncbi:DUF3073 domain-containing protein [Nesterenkonia sandarakina]|nr:DUF3073 domain-containing protein [Nesterenkonia sandarakina]